MRLGGVLAGLVLVILGITHVGAAGSSSAPAAPTTVVPHLTTTTTVAGQKGPGPAAPAPVLTAPPRGGATAGTTAKPADDEWPIRQIVTTVGAFVLGLALLGFVYGRIRSTSPRRPPLAPTSD
jgi:hypothetical protein